MIKNIHVILTLLVFSAGTFAGDSGQSKPDLSQIEETERQYIIKELTYRLDTSKNCNPEQKWSDKGSGAEVDGYFFIPSIKDKSFMIGGYATQSRKEENCVITVTEPQGNPDNTPKLLAAPVDWKLIWKDKGSGAQMDGSMWEAIPPDNNYKCLGSIPQSGYAKPDLSSYRCVHVSLTEKITSKTVIWTEKGSHADSKVTILRLPNTNSFLAVQGRAAKIDTYDLKRNPAVKPDPKLVEEKLAVRMEKIQQELKAGMQAEIEKKNLSEKAEQMRLAEAAEQKRLAEAAEQERLDRAAEQKRLAETTEQKQLASAAEQKRLAEQAEQERLASAAEQKQLAEAAEQERLANAAGHEQLAENAEQMQLPGPAQPAPVTGAATGSEIAGISNENTGADDDDKKSGAVQGLFIYLLKITLVVVGLFVILGFIIYKSMKGSKNKAGA